MSDLNMFINGEFYYNKKNYTFFVSTVNRLINIKSISDTVNSKLFGTEIDNNKVYCSFFYNHKFYNQSHFTDHINNFKETAPFPIFENILTDKKIGELLSKTLNRIISTKAGKVSNKYTKIIIYEKDLLIFEKFVTKLLTYEPKLTYTKNNNTLIMDLYIGHNKSLTSEEFKPGNVMVYKTLSNIDNSTLSEEDITNITNNIYSWTPVISEVPIDYCDVFIDNDTVSNVTLGKTFHIGTKRQPKTEDKK